MLRIWIMKLAGATSQVALILQCQETAIESSACCMFLRCRQDTLYAPASGRRMQLRNISTRKWPVSRAAARKSAPASMGPALQQQLLRTRAFSPAGYI